MNTIYYKRKCGWERYQLIIPKRKISFRLKRESLRSSGQGTGEGVERPRSNLAPSFMAGSDQPSRPPLWTHQFIFPAPLCPCVILIGILCSCHAFVKYYSCTCCSFYLECPSLSSLSEFLFILHS